MAYAETTTVAFEKSVSEIIMAVRKAGAGQIGQFEGPDYYAVQFVLGDRLIRFRLPFPSLDTIPKRGGNNIGYTNSQRLAKLEQRKRQRGRAMLLVIKAKLESVESGIETLEQAFLAHVVMSDGKTVYERIAEPIALEYSAGRPSSGDGLLMLSAQ